MRHKKGAIPFAVVIVVMTVFVLIYAWTQFSSKYNSFEKRIGERQYGIIGAYQKAEHVLLFIDQSAKYSLQQSVYELARNGGISEIEEEHDHEPEDTSGKKCGEIYGYSVWHIVHKTDSGFRRQECRDKMFTGEYLTSLFNFNLNKYLLNHPHEIPIDNYNYETKGNLEIIGKATTPIYFDILKDREAPVNGGGEKPAETIGLRVEPTTTVPNILVSYKYKLEAPERPNGALVDRIILHHTGDDGAGKTYNTLKSRELSVHYIVDRDGTVYYAVDERKMAYHAKGWNSRSIGIEIVNTGYSDMDYTDAQYDAVKSLVNDIAARWPSIKVDDEYVVGHYEASTIGKWDPSPNFEWARIGLPEHPKLSAQGKKAPSEFGYA